jgi:DNA-binding LacI/PurR family transcriptional regulator
LGGPRSATSTQDREKGFVTELANFPDVRATISAAGAYSFEAGRTEMLRLLDADDVAEAYFCGDDVLSIGALSAIADAGMKVPDDIGIIGLNDMEMASWANINLTTIHNPLKDIIAKSIDLVAAMVQDTTMVPKAHLFDCSVVERGTLRPLP